MTRQITKTFIEHTIIVCMLFLVTSAAGQKNNRNQAMNSRPLAVPHPLVALPGHHKAVSTFFSSLQGWAKNQPARRPKLVIALDVDGTCADLNSNPKAVQLKPGLIREVKALQKNGVTIIFVTGRAGSEIGRGPKKVYPELLDFERYTDHGAIFRGVGRRASPSPTHDRVKKSLGNLLLIQTALKRAVYTQLVSRIGRANAVKLLAGRFEQKDLGLAIHWRGQSKKASGQLKYAAQKAWISLSKSQRRGFSFAIFGNVTQETPLRDGMELRIAGVTKGDSMRDLVQRHHLLQDGRSKLIFIGDSGTDENGFAALRKIFPEKNALGIRVDARHDVKTLASARLDNPAAVLTFLTQLRKSITAP